MKISKTLCVLFAFGSVNAAYAADGSSGCGLGWMLLKDNSLLSSSLRSTTHAWLPNTFSMTSGTSGCAKHSIVKNDKKDLHFADANYEILATELAQGQGEMVTAFAVTLGCTSEASETFGRVMQENYENLFNTSVRNPLKLVQGARLQILANPSLRFSCHNG